MSGANSGGTNSGTSGTGSGAPIRAIDAALSTPTPFRPRATQMAMRGSYRHAERWAPEQDAPARSRSLGALSFADRVLSPYVEQASRSGRVHMFSNSIGGEVLHERDVEPTSWVFPRPWYQDELSWLAAARATGTVMGQASALSTAVSGPGRVASGAGRVVPDAMRRSGEAPGFVPLELVAPSMAPGHAMGGLGVRVAQPGALTTVLRGTAGAPPDSSARSSASAMAARPQALRVWSPLVPFRAVQAAEIMSSALSSPMSRNNREGSGASESRMLLEYVAPRDIAEARSGGGQVSAEGGRARTIGTTGRQEARSGGGEKITESARNRLQSAIRRMEARRKEERTLADTQAQNAAQAAAGAAMPESRLSATPSARSSAPASGTTTGTGVTGAELLARAALAGGQPMEPVGGPRIALPTGLGGLVSAVRARGALSQPLVRTAAARGSAPVGQQAVVGSARVSAATVRSSGGALVDDLGRAAPEGAGSALADVSVRPASSTFRAVTGGAPRAMQHMAWSDRWLARFAGASRQTLAVLDAVTRAPASAALASGQGRSLQMLSADAPAPVFIAPGSEPVNVQELHRPAPLIVNKMSPSAVPAGQVVRPARGALPRQQASFAPVGASPAQTDSASKAPQGRSGTASGQPSSSARPAPGSSQPASSSGRSALRMDDNEAVSDEMFAAIARASAQAGSDTARRETARLMRSRESAARHLERTRTEQAARKQPSAARTEAQPDPGRATAGRGFVDRLLEFGPVAPGPGMRAALAASPIAPALHAVLPLPAIQGFDVRSIYSSDLARAYMLGVIEPSMELIVPAPRVGLASSTFAPLFTASIGRQAPAGAGPGARADEPVLASLAATAPVSEFVAPVATGQEGEPARATAPAASSSAPAGAGGVSPRGHEPMVMDIPGPLLPTAEARAAQMAALSPLSRTAPVVAASAVSSIGASSGTTAAAMMSTSYAYGPGQAGVRAESWSVEQERNVADLAFDFVPPELVMAARVYGFSPAEAAQAARLSIAGPQGLAALARAVDLAFIDNFADVQVQQSMRAVTQGETRLAAGMGRAQGPGVSWATSRSGAATGASESRVSPAPARQSATAAMGRVPAGQPGAFAPAGQAAWDASGQTSPRGQSSALGAGSASPSTSWRRNAFFGMPLRAPKGSFLWPQAALSALDLQPEDADARQPLSLAALDVLAARAVADVGMFVTPDGTPATLSATGTTSSAARAATLAAASPAQEFVVPTSVEGAADTRPATGGTPGALTAAAQSSSSSGLSVPPGFSAKPGSLPRDFEALYVALSSSPAGRSLSPAVRAARALALANASSTGMSSARVRAAAAWAAMPMVIPGDDLAFLNSAGDSSSSERSAGAPSQVFLTGASPDKARTSGGTSAGAPSPVFLSGAQPEQGATASGEQRRQPPELRVVASRAGDAMRSFVAPHVEQAQQAEAHSSQARSSGGAQGARLRVPTAAQPLVNTGRPSASPVNEMIRSARTKRAAGEADIPVWFEKAARQMFENSSDGGISLAEMTLVTAAPARHIAASPKTANASAATAPASPGGSEQSDGAQPSADVQRLAEEVYAEICRLIEIAKERNGEPWR